MAAPSGLERSSIKQGDAPMRAYDLERLTDKALAINTGLGSTKTAHRLLQVRPCTGRSNNFERPSCQGLFGPCTLCQR